jgi:hypothetical protein
MACHNADFDYDHCGYWTDRNVRVEYVHGTRKEGDIMTLEELLLGWGLSGVGVGLVTAWLWQQIEKGWYWAADLEVTAKRICVALLGFIVVNAFYWAAIFVIPIAGPTTWRVWLAETVGYAIAAFSGSTLFHGKIDNGEDPVELWHLAEAIDKR